MEVSLKLPEVESKNETDDEILVEPMEKSLKSSEVESKNETNDQGPEIIKVEKEEFVMEDEIFDEVKVQGLNVQDVNDDHFEEEEICQHPKFGDVKCNTFDPEMKIANDRSDDLQEIKGQVDFTTKNEIQNRVKFLLFFPLFLLMPFLEIPFFEQNLNFILGSIQIVHVL